MNKIGKTLLICMVLFIIAAAPVFSNSNELEAVQNSANAFSKAMAKSLPFNSTIGLNWSDAYIGQLLGVPPAFGIGFSTGFTTLDFGSISNLAKAFGVKVPAGGSNAGFPIPAYTVEARVGGIFVPFDVGLKFGYLDVGSTGMFSDWLNISGINYTLFGFDVRYKLVDIKIFKLSVGAGYNYLDGGIGLTVPVGIPGLEFGDAPNKYTIEMEDPSIGLSWKTHVFDFKTQASFSLIFITPYAGLGLSYARSQAGYSVKSDITVSNGGTDVNIDNVIDDLKGMGLTGISETGFESIIKPGGQFNMRAFGGISLNIIPFVRFDLTLMYSFNDSTYGGTFGARFQL